MERQAKDGTIYQKVGEDSWTPVTRTAKDGTVYKKVGADSWSPMESKSDSPSVATSAVRKAIQGASSGFSDELAGLTEAAGSVVGVKGAGGPIKDISAGKSTIKSNATGMGPAIDWEALKASYLSGRDKERAALKKDSAANPATSAIAELAGAIASPINKIVGPAGAARGGAVIGGAQAAGGSDADNAVDLAKDTGIGILTGATVGKLADVATPRIEAGVKKVGQKAKDIAEMMSARSLGAERGTIKKLGNEAVKKAGRYALDNDVVTALNNTEGKIVANEAAKKSAVNARKGAYDTIDEASASQFNPKEAATAARDKILEGKNPNHDDVKELIGALDPHLKNILSRGDENISMAEAQKLVESLKAKAKFDTSRSNQGNEVAKSVYESVRKSINEAAEKGADKIGVGGLGLGRNADGELDLRTLRQIIEDSNSKYSSGKVAEELLKNKNAREQGNRLVGLTDTITGAGAAAYGGATGDWTGAGEIVVAKKLIEKYGAQMAARGLDKVAKKLLAVPEMAALAEKSPAAFQSIVSHFESPKTVLQKSADNEAPKKGPAKWANDGHDKLLKHAGDDEMTVELLQKAKTSMIDNPKLKKLLIEASDLKPGSKALDKVVLKMKAQIASDE